MSQDLLLTVGNNMMGDDGAGPLLAQLCRDHPVGWSVIEGGTMPEDSLHLIRKIQPRRVLVVDAADFGEKAGKCALSSPIPSQTCSWCPRTAYRSIS